ncbi:hypothetical protein [Microbacterium sp. P04]|uniref:hypothetical protein n=1 Tax=Microbacterium sp. P04 TaxID=3366947 RepID=UPI003747619A
MITTNDVAAALVHLTAAIAKDGQAEAVTIPIVVESTGVVGDAELVIGVGNDVLSAPVGWDADEPDFSEAAARLQAHSTFPRRGDDTDDGPYEPGPDAQWDPDLEGFAPNGDYPPR